MYIDFHTHAFADELAERAIKKLVAIFPCDVNTDGTVADLKRVLRGDGVERAVMLPIATKPTQQRTINDISVKLNSYELICFGSTHPDAPDRAEEMERIHSLGLKGIKLHPDYQNFFIEDERMTPVYEKCQELGLIVAFHSGYDPISPELHHCTPEAAGRLARKYPDLRFVFAHLGGMYCFDDTEKYLVGLRNVWLDTAFLAGRISDEQLMRVIRNHGSDRILLGSDMPWQRTSAVIEMIKNLPLTEKEKEQIFHENAENLLGEI